MEHKVKTRFLILSDTHGADFSPSGGPLQNVDVAIHCGDLTDGSKLEEFRTAIRLLRNIDSPLKLVIAGNHDFTMDFPAFEKKVAEASPTLERDLVEKEYGALGDARQLFDDARGAGIIFLDEGMHSFSLQNGAKLIVFASPYTPALGAWGFQYAPEKGHNFNIDQDVDVIVTHGPPKGIMDYTHGRERAGCPQLFAATAQARPLLHCFGHIHEGWGAKLVTWRDTYGEQPNHFTSIDNDRSHMIEKLSSLNPSRFDSAEDIEQKLEKVDQYNRDRCCTTSHCTGDEHPVTCGEQTLFVNAAMCDDDHLLEQKPWLVELDLPVSIKPVQLGH